MLYSAEGIPGTGKTTLAKNIFEESVKKGFSVCYETFRRNMANDFIRRLSDPDKFNLSWVSTTHGICFRLLASEFGYGKDNVATSKTWKEFCKKLGIPVNPHEVQKLTGDNSDFTTHINEIESEGAKIYVIYQNCLNMLISIDDWHELPPGMQPSVSQPYNTQIPTIIDKWITFLEYKGLIDFPQMLQKTLEYKLSPPTDVYISDEFQDKTPIQYELFKLWSKDKEKVVVFFDKNQAIYSFWGTNPRFCDEVRKKSSKFKILSPSWRLSMDVYRRAGILLKMSDQEVFDVKCVGQTTLIETDYTKLREILNIFNNIMIISRTNYHLAIIAEHLMSMGIPFTGRFGWSDKQLQIYSFVWKYRFKHEPIYKSEFMTYLKSTKTYPEVTLKFLQTSMKSKLTIEDVNTYLPATHKRVLMSNEPFKLAGLSEKGIEKLTTALIHGTPPRHDVFLTTIHGAKGLEADTVIVIDGISTKIQTTMAKDSEERKNEFRVWYVALTRARKHCIVIRNPPIGFNVPFLPFLNHRGEVS